MTLPKYSIRDQLFSHAFSSSNWYKPSYFEWDFKNLSGEFVFLTDGNVFEVNNPELKRYKKYAWLVESPVVTSNSYRFVEENPLLFDKIFTHSETILLNPNAHLVPIGGCRLDVEEVRFDYKKSKLISMMYSNKHFSNGHKLRHDIANKYSNIVDVMGSGVDGNMVKKIDSCRDYAFSIAIENCSSGFYFTEKIIDCFLSGTIPIYWGSPRIKEFFNPDGFIIFDDIDSLHNIITNEKMLVDFYNERSPHIIENFERALQFKIGEDYMYEHYNQIF